MAHRRPQRPPAFWQIREIFERGDPTGAREIIRGLVEEFGAEAIFGGTVLGLGGLGVYLEKIFKSTSDSVAIKYIRRGAKKQRIQSNDNPEAKAQEYLTPQKRGREEEPTLTAPRKQRPSAPRGGGGIPFSLGNMSGKNMAGLAAGVPPVMPAGNVSQGIPDYFTVILPYYDCNLVGESLTDNTGVATPLTLPAANTAIYRLNSIYDCKAYPGTFTEQPAFRDEWATLFTHYRVLEAFVSVKYINTNATVSDASTRAPVMVVSGLIGNKVAPDANFTSRPDRFFADKHGWTHLMGPPGSEDDIFTWDYHYKPETLDFNVADEGDVTVWSPIGASPSLPIHNLYLNAGKLKAGGDGNISDVSQVWHGVMEVRIKYKVQFRGAKYVMNEAGAGMDVGAT